MLLFDDTISDTALASLHAYPQQVLKSQRIFVPMTPAEIAAEVETTLLAAASSELTLAGGAATLTASVTKPKYIRRHIGHV